MDIKTDKKRRIRSRYLVSRKLFSDIFYELYDGVDLQENFPVFIIKFHKELVSPSFVDICVQSLTEYLYQPIQGMFELVDFEFNGEEFFIIYKSNTTQLTALDLYLNDIQKSDDSSTKRYQILLQISRILYSLEQNQLVFGAFNLNNIFVNESGKVTLGPAKVNLICLEYFFSKIETYEGAIFLSSDYLKSFNLSTKSDIYSFGILAFYLVTGNWPYDINHSFDRLKKGFELGPQNPLDLNSNVSDKLNFFIMKSIQLDPEKRWSSFRLIIGILEGKETMKFEQLSNHLNTSDTFSDEIRSKRNTTIKNYLNSVSNLLLVIGLIFLGYMAYQAYFLKYEDVTLPQVESQELAVVSRQLSSLKLQPKVVKYDYHLSIPENHVIRTEPASGRIIKQGRTVKVYVSKGKQELQVPSLIGKNLSEISYILDGSTIQIQEMDRVFSHAIEAGRVVSQIPDANQYIFDSGVIQISLSKGSPVKVEKLMDYDEGFETVNINFEFNHGRSSYTFSIYEKVDEDEQELYLETHYDDDVFQEEFIVNKGSLIIIKLDGEIIYEGDSSGKQSDSDL